jgi:hypothetical protein
VKFQLKRNNKFIWLLLTIAHHLPPGSLGHAVEVVARVVARTLICRLKKNPHTEIAYELIQQV